MPLFQLYYQRDLRGLNVTITSDVCSLYSAGELSEFLPMADTVACPRGKSSLYRRSGCVLWPCFSWCRSLSVDRRKVTREGSARVVRYGAPGNSAEECEQRRLLSQIGAEERGLNPIHPKLATQVKARLFTGMATGERPNTGACHQCTGSVLCRRCPVMVIGFD